MNSGNCCLITGATGGLGAALARRFWDSGFDLCLVGRDAELLADVVRGMPARTGQKIYTHLCDLAIPHRTSELVAGVRATVSRLAVLINNAAIHGPIGPLWENDVTAWQQAIQVNLLAPMALCHAFIPWMRKTGGGTIINLSGGGATGPRANFSAYGTAKAALVRASETVAEEVRPYGINVNCIAPGGMPTALLGEILEQGAGVAGAAEFAAAGRVFAGGGSSMARVTDLALFLASDAGNGITGKLISAQWDNWEEWPEHLQELVGSDLYTLRRITGRDRGVTWGDK